MSASGGGKAIVAALAANAGIAVAKFVGFAITGSSSMLAEGVHSVADTRNQGLLLFGRKRARREADRAAPLRLRARPLLLLVHRGAAAVQPRLGVRPLRGHPQAHSTPRTSPAPFVAVVILVVAIGLETYSFRTAIKESREIKGDAVVVGLHPPGPDPELPVVLLEDLGALVGLVLALGGVGLSVVTGDAVWDAHRHDLHRRAAGRHRDHPDRRDEEPADRRGRHAPLVPHDHRRAGRRAGRAGDPHPHAVPRPGGAAGRRQDRVRAVAAAGDGRRRRSTTPRRACATRCPRPA